MFRFASPLFLILLLIPPLVLFFRRRKPPGHIQTPTLEGMDRVPVSFAVRVSKFLPLLKTLALVLLILALARPQWGDRKINVTTEGVNIILALDLSESMSALDFKLDGKLVTRLEAVKSVVRDFILKREGDRIGMVVFGSNAFTQVPLTRDYHTIAFILDRLEIGAAGPRTAIGDAIGISLKRLEDIESKSNLIILLTDGKSNSGQLAWEDAAKIAAGRGVKIHTIGIGTEGEAPFLVDGFLGKRYVYQKVEMDMEALKTIAKETRGSFFEAADLESLEKIYAMIDSLEKTKKDIEKWVEYEDLYPGLLAAGMGFLVSYIFLSNTRFLESPEMKFSHPYLLNLLWALIPFFGIMAYGILEQQKILSRFAEAGMRAALIPGYDPRRRWLKAVLTTLAAGCAVVALAGPQWGYRWETVNEKGVDLMIALDCSKSMLAGDIQPDRLERAKREIIDLLGMMKSDRAGLVAFSGKAVLQCPLTLDHEAFHIFLKALTPGFLPVGGTNLSEALKTAYGGFEKESDTEKAVILITDGENTEGDAEETAKTMAKDGIRTFCIGVGGSEGAPIPDEKGGFKKDASGNIVLSKVDEKGLEKLAALTNGAYVRSVAGDMDLDLIYKDRIRGEMERRTLASGRQKVWENRFQWFLFPGLILLLAESMIGPGRRALRGFCLIPVLGLALWGFCPGPASAGIFSSPAAEGIRAFEAKDYAEAKKQFIEAQIENPEDKRLDYNIGTAAYMNKEYKEAVNHFSKALDAEDIALRHKARFNLGNTRFQMGDMDGAIQEYESVLKEFPDDQEAGENLELARRKKQEEQKKQEPGENKDKEKQDQDKDSEKQDQDKPKDQENSAPRDENQGKTEQEKNSGKDQGRDPDRRQDQPDKGQDLGKPEPPPEPGKGDPQPHEGPEPQAGQEQQAGESLDNMLNRLEDKPGSAMIPFLQEGAIEKDW